MEIIHCMLIDNIDIEEDNIYNNENFTGIKRTKNNHLKIITKRKEPNKKINGPNEVLDLNNNFNGSNDIQKGNLTKYDLKHEIVNDYTDYLNQGLDDTTSNNQYDRSQPSMIYNHKSITKNKPETRLHLNSEDIEEEPIVTDVKSTVYGIATKTRQKRHNEENDE